jgi:hypothetical protein
MLYPKRGKLSLNMNMSAFWKAALAVGGIAAIGAFVFWSLYKDWLSLDIFSRMNPEQTFEIMKIFLWLTFGSLALMVVTFLISKKPHKQANPDHVFELHKSWEGINEIDCNQLIGPDVTNAARAMTITASSWLNELVSKEIIYENHFKDYELLYNEMLSCQKVVPGFEKRGLKCGDFVSNEIKKTYLEMKSYEKEANK